LENPMKMDDDWGYFCEWDMTVMTWQNLGPGQFSPLPMPNVGNWIIHTWLESDGKPQTVWKGQLDCFGVVSPCKWKWFMSVGRYWMISNGSLSILGPYSIMLSYVPNKQSDYHT
jgi:hypothetical protein